MASVNMVIKKGYLLAGVMMAANMFIVNEVRAMEQTTIPQAQGDKDPNIKELNNNNQGEGEIKEEEKKKKENNNNKKNFFTQDRTKDTTREILFRENYFKFFGTLALSGVNNYFKWWNYDQGRYCKLGCFGWRSGRFLNGIFQFQFGININVGRGILWLIPGYLFFFVQGCSIDIKSTACSLTISSLFFLVRNNEKEQSEVTKQSLMKVIAFLLFILQGFISAPLAFHLSKFNFSISISLDAILWELVAIWARKKKERILTARGQLFIGEKIEET